MSRPDKYGFARTGAKGARRVEGFATGDIVEAVVAAGKKAGIYVGRVDVRATGSFNIKTKEVTVLRVSVGNSAGCYIERMAIQ